MPETGPSADHLLAAGFAPSWRDHVAWPAPADEELRATPVGRWNVLVDRLVRLRPARQGAPTVVARILEDRDPAPGQAESFQGPVRCIASVWGGGARVEICEFWSGLVEVYLHDGPPEEARDEAAAAEPAAPTRKLAAVATAAPSALAGQVSFGW